MELSAHYAHLYAGIRAQAEESAPARIRRIRTDRWITYSRAEAVLSVMEDLLSFPPRTRMPNLLLVGPTNNGKTMIVEKFRRTHPPIQARSTEAGIAQIPVLKIQMPPTADEYRFFCALLEALGLPGVPNERLSAKQAAAVRLMQLTCVKLLVIDEVHNVLSGSRDQQRRLLNLLRWLGNELQIPLVAVGTALALRAIQSDDQLANRFEPIALPPWLDGPEYRRLLSTLEAVLPLRCASQLSQSTLAQAILSASEGILGEIISLVTRAAVHAVRCGTEAISTRALTHSGFVSPTKRRRVAL